MIDLNRRWWDERVPIHLTSSFYDVDSFRSGRNTLQQWELDEVGEVSARSLLHLQCHFGLDTLSWARIGARATGVDFSQPAVEAAAQLAAELDIDATFVCSDVYDAVDALAGAQYDVVYTGHGALVWLPDIERWADQVARLVAPNGILYVSEFHPVTQLFGWEDDAMEIVHHYREGEVTLSEDARGSYADLETHTEHNTNALYLHTIGSVLTTLLDHDFQIELFRERDVTLYPRFSFLHPDSMGIYHTPSERPTLPHMYSVRARKG